MRSNNTIRVLYWSTKINVVVLLLVGIGLFHAPIAEAKQTKDPNHKGWYKKKGKIEPIQWKERAVKCESCKQIVLRYNSKMSHLLNQRFALESSIDAYRIEVKKHNTRLKNVKAGREAQNLKNLKAGREAQNVNEPIGSDETLRLARVIDRQEGIQKQHSAYKAATRARILILEKQIHKLLQYIADCELKYCKQKAKDKAILVDGKKIKGLIQPNANDIFKQNKLIWPGKYKTNCKPCTDIVTALNNIPSNLDWARQELALSGARIQKAKASNAFMYLVKLHVDDDHFFERMQAEDQHEENKQKIDEIVKTYNELIKMLAKCEQKKCPKIGMLAPTPLYECSADPNVTPIAVGANSAVGSSADFKEKTKNKAKGMVLGALAKASGLSTGGGGKDAGPNTYKDPVKNKRKIKVKEKKPKRELRIGGLVDDNGLLISSDIKKWPGKGTFHSIYLQNPRGWKIQPIGYYMYEIWKNWKLTVSWTRDTFVNDKLVKHEEGGWTESWREKVGSGKETIYGEVPEAPIWEILGFNTATSGARALGTQFPVTADMLAAEPMSLVVHITNPKEDPVTTRPYIFTINVDSKGRIKLTQEEQTVADVKQPCEEMAVANNAGSKFDELSMLGSDLNTEVGAAYSAALNESSDLIHFLDLYGGGADNVSTNYASALQDYLLDAGEQAAPRLDDLAGWYEYLQDDLNEHIVETTGKKLDQMLYSPPPSYFNDGNILNPFNTTPSGKNPSSTESREQDILTLTKRLGSNKTTTKPPSQKSDTEELVAQFGFVWDHHIRSRMNWVYREDKGITSLTEMLDASSVEERVDKARIVANAIHAELAERMKYNPIWTFGLLPTDILELEKKLPIFVNSWYFLKAYLNPNASQEQLNDARIDIYQEIARRYRDRDGKSLDELFDKYLKLRADSAKNAQTAGYLQLEISAIETDLEKLKNSKPKKGKKKALEQKNELKALQKELNEKKANAETARTKSEAKKIAADDLWDGLDPDKAIFLDDHIRLRNRQQAEQLKDPSKVPVAAKRLSSTN